MHATPVDHRMTVGHALMNHGVKHPHTLPLQNRASFSGKPATRCGIDDNSSGGIGKAGNLDG